MRGARLYQMSRKSVMLGNQPDDCLRIFSKRSIGIKPGLSQLTNQAGPHAGWVRRKTVNRMTTCQAPNPQKPWLGLIVLLWADNL